MLENPLLFVIKEEIIKNGIYRYYADLKVIGRHMSKLILEGNDSDSINKNSNFYKNYADSKNKTIIFSNLQTLSSVDYLKKYIDNNDKFNYVEKYEEEFKETNDPNYIIQSLLDNEKHKELNSIAYYKYNGDINSLTNLSRISANYLISILKTIYIKRYLTKRQENEYLHINLLLKDEFFITNVKNMKQIVKNKIHLGNG